MYSKRVNVLISTYNGELYIEDQINSILNQTYSNIKIYVRDDGSTDNTLNILKNYEADGKIQLIKGNNKGYGPSFLELLNIASEGDYWAFCDQDDVWRKNKIERAIVGIQKLDLNKPALYFHNYVLTDENLKNPKRYLNKMPKYLFSMAITQCIHMGFATLINDKLRDMMLRVDGDKLCSHDWWAELIVMEFGNVYTDDYIGAKHRRLDISISSSGMKARVKWFKKALGGNAEIKNLTNEFYREFSGEMNKHDRKILSWFVSEKYNFLKSVKKAFYIHRWRSSFSSELVVRFLMLIGRI